MTKLPEPLNVLIKQLSRLPGVGTKSAQRYAFSIMGMTKNEAATLSRSIISAKELVHTCPMCGCYTINNGLCDMCLDTSRKSEILCVVQSASDIFYMDNAKNGFNGKFHVIGGVLSPLDGITPNDLNIAVLPQRVRNEGIKEVIVATEPCVEGDATASYIAKLLKPLGVKVTRLAYGIPIGSNLEYVDSMTLSRAIDGRREI